MLNPVNLPAYRGVLRQVNLAIYQGDDWAATATVLNPDGSVFLLDGYTAQAQIRTGPADQTWAVAAEMFCLVNADLGQISLTLGNADTTLLTQPEYVWDLQVTGSDGEITTILRGEVYVCLEVTREDTTEQVLVIAEVRDPFRGLFI